MKLTSEIKCTIRYVQIQISCHNRVNVNLDPDPTDSYCTELYKALTCITLVSIYVFWFKIVKYFNLNQRLQQNL